MDDSYNYNVWMIVAAEQARPRDIELSSKFHVVSLFRMLEA